MAVERKYVETPLMKQYYRIKDKHPDAILLLRVGDFYETFGEDAIKASGILGITLTRRANGAASSVELAGFPHHAVDVYLPKLVRAGERVAICEQVEDPKLAKGEVVERQVIELVTPGVSLQDGIVESKSNSFLASVFFGRDRTGVAFADISTGEFYVAQGSDSYVDRLLSNLSPKEVLYQRNCEGRYRSAFGNNYYTYKLDDWVYAAETCREKLRRHLGTVSLKGFGIEAMEEAVCAAGAILYYLDFTEHKNIDHLKTISRIDEDKFVWIDRFTIRNLELFSSDNDRIRSGFVDIVDRTVTPMGGRLLKKWIALPIKDPVELDNRLDTVELWVNDTTFAGEVRDVLSQVCDLERIASRIASARILPREMIQLKRSLESVAILKELLDQRGGVFAGSAEKLDGLGEVVSRIAKDIYPDPGNQVAKGGVIADGVDLELDDLRNIAFRAKEYLNAMLEKQVEATGITSLRIGYNNVFGYYLEVKNTHKDKVPSNWTRKQTLANAERYITEELKEFEEKILSAESRTEEIELRIYQQMIEFLSGYLRQMQQDAAVVATLDCLLSFATVAVDNMYCRPQLDDSRVIDIRSGRHPVIEKLLPVGEVYVPNDIYLDDTTQQIMLITGPNMAGKSALLRQTALIVLMAQIGCFVPATSARIGIVDKIFTRVGASDNISQGESTFMVEMLESASILNNISDRSLVLLDEIGRGTSTYDGISIAWSMVEYLHEHPSRAKTLFATHYHELNRLQQMCERVRNYKVSVKEVERSIVFLRKLEPGGTEHSFGIHVAKMAGMPEWVVDRANKILVTMEKERQETAEGQVENSGKPSPVAGSLSAGRKKRKKSGGEDNFPDIQLTMFQLDDPVLSQIRDEIKGLDINSLTPIEALNKLNEIKKISGI